MSRKLRIVAVALAAAFALASCKSGQNNGNAATANTSGSGGTVHAAANPMLQPAPPPRPASFKGRVETCSGKQCTLGKFSTPVAEPTIRYSDSTTGTQEKVVHTSKNCVTDADGKQRCKPAAVSIALLPDNRLLYFNGLEGTENVALSIVAEYGKVSVDDQTRDMSLGPAGPEDHFSWRRPSPVRGGANMNGNYTSKTLLPGAAFTDAENKNYANQGALFCSDLAQLYNGNIIAVGGTDYYTEPSADSVFPEARNVLADFHARVQGLTGDMTVLGVKLPGIPSDIGVAELEGLRNARIYHYKTGKWTQTGSMTYGRWYPTVVTLPNGNIFIASGVTKLLKPVYLDNNPKASRNDILDSGRNVTYTETYDVDTGNWHVNHARTSGGSAQRSLPLFPRMDLLPNGDVYYAGGGQSFNPFGQAYDQSLWNFVGAYDPRSETWTDLGYAGLPLQLSQADLDRLTSAMNITSDNQAGDLARLLTGVLDTLVGKPIQSVAQVQQAAGTLLSPGAVNQALGSGFRGSTFAIMLPLRPDANGHYRRVNILIAGGVLGAVGAPSPGTYVGSTLSRIDTVTITDPSDPINGMKYSSHVTGDLTGGPRWFPYGVLLPDDSVMAFNGADRDDVATPGLTFPKRQSERFTLADPNHPGSGKWQPMAYSHHARTYHNTAILLPDGRVLIGGHAPISTAYLYNANLAKFGFSPDNGRDPSFEVYSPPYVFSKERPVITQAPDAVDHGQKFTVAYHMPGSPGKVHEVELIRRTATTHIVDGDQRSVVLPFRDNGDGTLTVTLPANPAVTPPGYYMLFINRFAGDGSGKIIPSVSAGVRVNRDAASKDYLSGS